LTEHPKPRRQQDLLRHIVEAAAERVARYTSGMDRASHAYFGPDLSIVWETIKTSVPDLEQQVRKLLD